MFPDPNVNAWHKLPQFTIMKDDLKPLYKKHLIKGFEKCDKTIRDQVRRMNEFTLFTSPGNEDKTRTRKATMKAKDVGDMDFNDIEKLPNTTNLHLMDGLIPLYTVTAEYDRIKSMHFKKYDKSASVEFTKAQISANQVAKRAQLKQAKINKSGVTDSAAVQLKKIKEERKTLDLEM